MAYITIPSGDVDQGSIIDEALMSGKIKNNFDDHETRILALEALSGGGSSGSAAVESPYANITVGGQTNEAQFWKFRHHVVMSGTSQPSNDSHADFEKTNTESRFFFDARSQTNSAIFSNTQSYLGHQLFLEQNESIYFRIKKGENFFCIGFYLAAVTADSVTVLVDNVNVNTLGLTDETGAVVPATFNATGTPNRYGTTKHFYGLDGEEHVVQIVNTSASAFELPIQYVDAGYRSPDYAIDHTIKLEPGVANVGGLEATFTGGNFSFTKPGEGLANGYTGMLKINQAGTVTAVTGLSPAWTQCKPNEAIAFDSGPVTSLTVKNHFAFPTAGGICLFQLPFGDSYLFSYTSKTNPNVANQTLAGIVWQSQPQEDFTPLVPMAAATAPVDNEFKGDARIDLWANAPILIDGTNNKVDFEITVNGVTTQHAATIASGYYSTDLVPIEKAFRDAMQAAKAIDGEYYLEWNEESQLYSYGVRDPEVSQIDFEWQTGANSANTFGSVVGQTADQTSALGYVGSNTRQHKAQRLFYEDPQSRDSEHPTIKHSYVRTDYASAGDIEELGKRLPYGTIRRSSGDASTVIMDILPDEDCCGMLLTFAQVQQGTYITWQVDSGDETYLGTNDRNNVSAFADETRAINFFISFPKGSHKITIKYSRGGRFNLEPNTPQAAFYGYKQFFTKPPWEGLTEQEKVLKTFEVWPLRLYGTKYGHVSALYTPQPADDNINSITESGTWAQTTLGTTFNRQGRTTSTDGSYVDIEFVLQGDGGGIGIIIGTQQTIDSDEYHVFLANGTITEATDFVELGVAKWGSTLEDAEKIQHIGLAAGTYTLRLKQEDTERLSQNAIVIYDTVPPQPYARTQTDINNTGQSVAFPLHTRKRNCQRYGAVKVNENFDERTYNRGIVSHYDYSVTTHSVRIFTENSSWVRRHSQYFSTHEMLDSDNYAQYTTFCRSISPIGGLFNTYSTLVQPSIDGRNTNLADFARCVKGGLAPNSTRPSDTQVFFNDFEFTCSHNAGLVYNITDTRGMRQGKCILVDNTGATEEAFIESFVTDVSFTLALAPAVLTPANIATVQFWGMHNVRLSSTDSANWELGTWAFEPLPIERSVLQERVNPIYVEDISEDEFVEGSSGTKTYELPHKNWAHCATNNKVEFEVIAGSNNLTNVIYETMSYTLSAGATARTRVIQLVNKALSLFLNG